MPRLAVWIAGTGLLALLAAAGAPAWAQSAPILFRADDITYDRASGVVTARGDIEVSVDDRILVADRVTYAERTGVITASGSVAVLQPNGDVFFADEVTLTEDLRAGVLSGFRALLGEHARVAAAGAERRDGNLTTMTRAAFTACKPCEEDRTRPPLWQIKAFEVIHDERRKRIEYKDVVLEFFGVPVAYTPYFAHTDPRVTRRSGLLAPTYGSSSQLGLHLQLPFYFDFAPHRDATIAPIVTTKEGVIGTGEYRERTSDGEFSLRGSLTRGEGRSAGRAGVPDRELRGHIFGRGRFEPDRTWSWGFDLQRATDDTYLRRYDFSNADSLTTNAFIEGFHGRSYASANAYLFQGLRSGDDPDTTPAIPALLDYSFVGEPGGRGQTWRLAANALVLDRKRGQSSRRLSLEGRWRLPYTSPGGALYGLWATLRGDLYHTDGTADPDDGDDDGFAGRLFPQVGLDWRYPLVAHGRRFRQIIEPIVVAIAAPAGGNPSGIPNEDSLAFEFSDANLLSTNRFPGFDRVEGGSRVNYGIKVGVLDALGGYANLLFGQSIRLRPDVTFADKTGLEGGRSDYVGRLDLVLSPLVDFNQRIRLDRDTFSIRRNEISLSAGPAFLRLDASFVSLSRELTADELVGREEIDLLGRWQITPRWALTAGMRRDLKGRRTLSYDSSIAYEDECLIFSIELDRAFFDDRDLEPSTSFTVQIKLKQLG